MNTKNEQQNDIANKAQPGSQESGTGGQTSTTGGDSQVDVKDVLNTNETGKSPENVNTVPDSSEDSKPREGGASDISAKELLNTNGSGEPSADNVKVSGKVSGYDDNEKYSTEKDDAKEGGASDISAKEEINTHGSGEPSADNVDVKSGSQSS